MRRNYIIFLLQYLLFLALLQKEIAKISLRKLSFQTVVLGDTITTNFTRVDDIEIDYFSKILTSSVKWISECECIVKKKNQSIFKIQRPFK